jgi:hypothetical protein
MAMSILRADRTRLWELERIQGKAQEHAVIVQNGGSRSASACLLLSPSRSRS